VTTQGTGGTTGGTVTTQSTGGTTGGAVTTQSTGGTTGGTVTTQTSIGTPGGLAGPQAGSTTVSVRYNAQTHTVLPVIPRVATGQAVLAKQPNGLPVPCWLTIDPRTGAIGGSPAKEDIAANVPVVVVEHVPLADGTTQAVTITVKPDQFPQGGSHCGLVRTNPAP